MMNCKLHSLAAFAVVSATFLTFTSCGKKDAQQMAGAGAAPQIGVMTVEQGASDLNSAYSATIKGKTDIEVRPLVSGFITKVHVDEGQRVSKGQTLFTLDQVQYQAAVEQAQAAVASAKTALESAKLTAANKQRLFDKNIISEYENQLAKNQLAQAEASLSQAQAALVTARKNLSYTVVTAPSDGFVGSIPNREGSLASPSMMTPLTTVSDNSDIYAYFSLNEKDILANVNAVNDSLFSWVLADNILVEKRKSTVIRGGGQANDKGIKIGQHLAPHIINGAVAFIHDNAVKELRRNFGIVDDLFWCFAFGGDIFRKGNLFCLFVQFFPF